LKSSMKLHGGEPDALAGGMFRFGIATSAARTMRKSGRIVRFTRFSPLQGHRNGGIQATTHPRRSNTSEERKTIAECLGWIETLMSSFKNPERLQEFSQ